MVYRDVELDAGGHGGLCPSQVKVGVASVLALGGVRVAGRVGPLRLVGEQEPRLDDETSVRFS